MVLTVLYLVCIINYNIDRPLAPGSSTIMSHVPERLTGNRYMVHYSILYVTVGHSGGQRPCDDRVSTVHVPVVTVRFHHTIQHEARYY